MIEIKIENNGELVVFNVLTTTSFQEITNNIKDNYHIVKRFVLWDFGDTDLSGLSTQEIRNVSEVVKQHALHEKTAYVGNTTLEIGLLNMYKAYADISEVIPISKVFQTKEEAIEWLYSN